MGWLIDIARRTVPPATAPWIAMRMLKWDKPKLPRTPVENSLANYVRDLDSRKNVGWWLVKTRESYRKVLAAVLKIDVAQLMAEIERGGDADRARWFHFEVFPRLAPIDLDGDELYPGIPNELLEDGGPSGRVWWFAPRGAGRTLVGRWLERRHGWHRSATNSRAPLFVEQDAPGAPGVSAKRLVIACPHSMPERFDGREVRLAPSSAWIRELVDWVSNRIRPGGRFDRDQALRWFESSKIRYDAPGQAIEVMALMDQDGLAALDIEVPARLALARWVTAHADRQDRPVKPASRAFLRDHGASLMVSVELKRRLDGLPASRANFLQCMPSQPPAPSADAVFAAAENGLDAVRALVRPQADDLLQAMSDLQWIVDQGWWLPSRVETLLRQAVVDEIASRPIAELGQALAHDDLVEPVLAAIAEPKRLSELLGAVDALDDAVAGSVLVVDALARAATLCVARGAEPPTAGLIALSTSLSRLSGSAPPWFQGLPFRLAHRSGSHPLALLVLHQRVSRATSDYQWDEPSFWNLVMHVESTVVNWHDDFAHIAPELRRLALDVVADIADAQTCPNPMVATCMRDLCRDRPLPRESARMLAGVGPVDLLDRMVARWHGNWQRVARVLWPFWLAHFSSVPWQKPRRPGGIAILNEIWAAVPAHEVLIAHTGSIVAQAAAGVTIPAPVWSRLAVVGAPRDGLEPHIPTEVLNGLRDTAEDAELAKWANSLIWHRDSKAQLARLAKELTGDRSGPVKALLDAAPSVDTPDVLSVIQSATISKEAAPAVREWLGQVMRDGGAQRQPAYCVWRTLLP